MAQSSKCQTYQGNWPPNSIQPHRDGGNFSLSSSTSCARQFSPHFFQRDSKIHDIQVGSDSQSATFSGQSVADDSSPESPSNPWHRPGFLHGSNISAVVTYDNPADFFGDLPGDGCEDLPQTASFHAPPQTKTRTFPRTNPSYVGLHQRDGSCSYRKTSPERQQVRSLPSTMAVINSLSQSYFSDMFDRKRGFHHERSDNDTSRSPFGSGRLQQDITNSHASQSSSLLGRQDPTADSLSSQGSLKSTSNAANSALGSKSSAKYNNKQFYSAKVSPQSSLSSHSSPYHTANIDSNCHRRVASEKRQGIEVTASTRTRTRTRRNSEPDYANLPMVTCFMAENGTKQRVGNTVDISNKLCGAAVDERNGKNISSPCSSSPDKCSKKEYVPSCKQSFFPQNFDGFTDRDSETSSVFSSPLLGPWQMMDSAFEVQQPGSSEVGLRAIGKSKSLDVDDRVVQPLSTFSFCQSDDDLNSSPVKNNVQNQMGIEQFALENFNEHRQGILGKTVPISNMLTWTKDIISKPMIRTQDKVVKKEAPEVFRLIQMYMSDRKAKSPHIQIALEIVQKGWSIVKLRDEIYMQLCRQTTENHKEESLMHGWELMGLCLSVFPPSFRFHSYLEGYICQHLNLDDSQTLIIHFACHCQRQLERISKRGAKGSAFNLTIDYVEQTLKSLFHPSNFGGTLEDIMQIQKYRFPDRLLPWIQTTLSEEVLRLNGTQTEGIFRVSGDADEVNALKTHCDQWDIPSYTDLHAIASLLKQWYRELYEPLIPSEFYDECIASCSDPDAAIAVVERLPSINRLVFCYLIRFLQVFAALENANISKMDASNLATVMAPNCLRCESEDPNVILKNAHKEASFIKTLILNLDTSFMEGIW